MAKSNIIGSKVAFYRKRAGLRQQDLANKLSKSRSAVALWESGTSSPSLNSLKTIANTLGVSLAALLGDDCPVKDKEVLSIKGRDYYSFADQKKEIVIPRSLITPYEEEIGTHNLFYIYDDSSINRIIICLDKKNPISVFQEAYVSIHNKPYIGKISKKNKKILFSEENSSLTSHIDINDASIAIRGFILFQLTVKKF